MQYGADKCYIEFIDVSSLTRQIYDMLVEARAKGKLVLIAEKVKCRPESGNILLVVDARFRLLLG
jgi:hypothetical protein